MSIKGLRLMRKRYLQCVSEDFDADVYNFMTEVIYTFEALKNLIDEKEGQLCKERWTVKMEIPPWEIDGVDDLTYNGKPISEIKVGGTD